MSFYMKPSMGMFTKTCANQSAAPRKHVRLTIEKMGVADLDARVKVNKNMWIALLDSMKDCVCQRYV